jgi:hypothetical protein
VLSARTIAARIASAGVLALPTILAFNAGGFFEGSRARAGIVVWVALAGALAWGFRLLPASRAGRLAVGGLLLLAAWTTAAIAWAPLRDPAVTDAVAVWLYAGYLLLALAALRGPQLRIVEPALAGGTVLVTGYALATRLLPTVVPSVRSGRAGARLDQPLTYWNALGLVAALGVVLLVRLASDETRPPRLRAIAAALAPVPGLALYLTFSRGSLLAAAVGLALLLVLEHRRRAVIVMVVCLGCIGVAAAATSRFAAIDSLNGSTATQRTEGLAVLAIVLICCGVAGLGAWLVARGAADELRLRGLAGVAAAALAACAIVGGVVALTRDPAPPAVPVRAGQLPTNRQRLGTLQTNRLDYWRVAVRAFADKPLAGLGTHGFAVRWLKRRPIGESVQDVHSLYLETAVELGLVGLLALALFLGGAAAVGAGLVRGSPAAVGPIAACATFLVHAGLDWDWEMPAVSLIFVALVAWILLAEDQPATT